ncbi:MAG TPA: hypothetical protein VGC55_15945 [Dokdonella sp.]
MTPRLDRGEYWLLTNAAEAGQSLRVLTLPEWPQDDPHVVTIDIVLNKRGHGLNLDELAQTLCRLAERGWIELLRDIQSEALLHPEKAEIGRILEEKGLFRDGAFYRLTTSGAQAWESFARPEWHRYILRSSYGEEDSPTEEVIAASEKSLKQYMASVAHETPIEPGSEVYDEQRPWRATYWKTLPVGFRCRYRERAEPARPGAAPTRYFPPTAWLSSRWCPWL